MLLLWLYCYGTLALLLCLLLKMPFIKDVFMDTDNAVIGHTGVVTAVADGRAVVRLEADTACGGCRIASVCNGHKRMEVTAEANVAAKTEAAVVRVGDRVRVVVRERTRYLAIGLLLVVPLVVLVATVIVMRAATGFDDGVISLCGIGAVAVIYTIIYMMMKKQPTGIQWHITEIVSRHSAVDPK